jgi:hypothetical protein
MCHRRNSKRATMLRPRWPESTNSPSEIPGTIQWHVTEVTERHLEDFLRTLAAAGRAPSTRNHYLRLLRLLGRLAVRK